MVLPKSISEDAEVLSTADVARVLQVHRGTVWLWIRNGMLKSVRHGTFHGVKPAALERFRSQYTVASRSKRSKGKKP